MDSSQTGSGTIVAPLDGRIKTQGLDGRPSRRAYNYNVGLAGLTQAGRLYLPDSFDFLVYISYSSTMNFPAASHGVSMNDTFYPNAVPLN
jgi:hypothetical protein